MGVAIKDIPGAVVAQLKCADVHDDVRYGVSRGWNQCREEQGAVEITLKSIPLFDEIRIVRDLRGLTISDGQIAIIRDAILDNLPQLLVAVKTK